MQAISPATTLAQTSVVNDGKDMAIIAGSTLVLVTSHSEPGSWHRVNPIVATCDCKGFEMRRQCRHLDGAREALGSQASKVDPTRCQRCNIKLSARRLAIGQCCLCDLAIEREQREASDLAGITLARGFVR